MTAVVNEESGGSTTVATPGAGIPRVSSWCHSQGKRLFDVLVVSFSLLLCLPLMAIIAIMVAVTSPRAGAISSKESWGERERVRIVEVQDHVSQPRQPPGRE